jgi:ATP-dependent exoDNAse (exonuclease V) beta subunit
VFASGGYAVVWWEPGSGGGLTLGEKPPFGVRREELIVKDVARDVVADGRTQYDRWRLARADARASGARPSIVLETVRERAAVGASASGAALPAAVDPAAITIVSLGGDDIDVDRPGGAAFGALVHAVLARASFDADRDQLSRIAAVEARILGLPGEDAAAAVRTVERVRSHDLLVRAMAASARGACRRETPVTLKLEDGTLVEGVVDLAFEEQGAWTVVDYKTDREIAAAGEEQYRRQVALYAAAIARATGAAVTGVLVRL